MLGKYWDNYTEMHGQQNDKYTEIHGQQNVKICDDGSHTAATLRYVTLRYVTDNEHVVRKLLAQPHDHVAGTIVSRQ